VVPDRGLEPVVQSFSSGGDAAVEQVVAHGRSSPSGE
jgi:hypothetical protein